jgi:hypothetical protein
MLIDCRYGGRYGSRSNLSSHAGIQREPGEAAHVQILRRPPVGSRQIHGFLSVRQVPSHLPSTSAKPRRSFLPAAMTLPLAARRTFPDAGACLLLSILLHQGRVTLAFLPLQSSDATTTTP